MSQSKGGPIGEKNKIRKKSHNAEKLEGGPFGIFKHPICCKISKKLKGGFFGEKKFWKKNLTVPKKIERGDPLVSPGVVCYAEKQENPFWFSSLGQMVQFGEIIFCRTFKNYFGGQFVWIEKKSHYNSRVSLHEAPTKKQRQDTLISCNVFHQLKRQNKTGTSKVGAKSKAQKAQI